MGKVQIKTTFASIILFSENYNRKKLDIGIYNKQSIKNTCTNCYTMNSDSYLLWTSMQPHLPCLPHSNI